MGRYRLSDEAKVDLRDILAISRDRWGEDGRRRYRALLTSAMRRVAGDPGGVGVSKRDEYLPGLRSFPIRLARREASALRIANPVHVLYFWIIAPGLVEILRVLHERMEPRRHLTKTP